MITLNNILITSENASYFQECRTAWQQVDASRQDRLAAMQVISFYIILYYIIYYIILYHIICYIILSYILLRILYLILSYQAQQQTEQQLREVVAERQSLHGEARLLNRIIYFILYVETHSFTLCYIML